MNKADSTNQNSPVKTKQEQPEPSKEEAKLKNIVDSYVIIEKEDKPTQINKLQEEKQDSKEKSNDFINDFYILESIPEEIKNHSKKKESRFLKFFKTMFFKKEDTNDTKETEKAEIKHLPFSINSNEFSNEFEENLIQRSDSSSICYSKIIDEIDEDSLQYKPDDLNHLSIDKLNEFNVKNNKWNNPSYNSFGSTSTATNNNSIAVESPVKNISNKEDTKLNDLLKINAPSKIQHSLTTQFNPVSYANSANKSTIIANSGIFLGNSFALRNSNVSNDSANSVRIPSFLSPKLLNSSQTSKYSSDELDLTVKIEKILSLEDKRTTLMIKNIPNKFTRQVLLTILEQRMKETFDLFILPTDANKFKNFGYGFINFLNSYYIPYFYFMFNGKMWSGTNSKKVCEITYSKIQGHQNLIGHYPSKIIHWNGIAQTADKDQKYIIPKEYLPYFRSVFKDFPIEEFKYYFLTKLPKIDGGNQ